jgi:hypothetical protein
MLIARGMEAKSMDVVKLQAGDRAPVDSDCATIEAKGDLFFLTASALVSCGDAESVESVSLVGGEPYHSYDEAESAALAWASSHGVQQFYIVPTAP